MVAHSQATAPWQTRPVFVSSTFRDMQAERDYLRHVIFPRVEEELRKGRIRFEAIDLRQGVEAADVRDEVAREQLVLKVCLEEIQRSRPFLIVLLGDRYGWVPPEDRIAAAAEEVGFATELGDKSVTALEIEFGILKQRPEQQRRSFFYLRDPLPYDRMPESLRAEYCDKYSVDPDTQRRHGRLNELKLSLANDPELALRVYRYRAEWDATRHEVVGLEAWGEQVYHHLLKELDTELRAASTQPPQTWEEQERAELAEFIEHRGRDFVGRQELLNELIAIAKSPAPADAVFAIPSGVLWGACVNGEPGSGKSAIFAELATRLQVDESVFLLRNAAGATARGSQVDSMLERFIRELSDVLDIDNPLPEKATADDVDATFASLLGRVAVKRRVIVLLDALNQFDQTTRAEHLTWFRARQWPANARIIATSLPCTASKTLSQWDGIEARDVPPLNITDDEQNDDVATIAKAVYGRYHRQVNWPVVRVLRGKRQDGSPAAGNPLWLTLALEQINLLDADDFARADRDFAHVSGAAERQRAMLIDTAQRMPPTVAEMYGWLLAQSEKVFGVAASRSFAALIAVSRLGWRESDLLKLIPTAASVLCPSELEPEVNALQLAAVRRSFRAHLVRRGTLQQLDFCHQQMRHAVFQRSLAEAVIPQRLHRAIADYLESLIETDALRVTELMHHLIEGDSPLRAARLFIDLPEDCEAFGAATRSLAECIASKHATRPQHNTQWVIFLLDQDGLTSEQKGILARRLLRRVDHTVAHNTALAEQYLLVQGIEMALRRLTQINAKNVTWREDLAQVYRRLGAIAKDQGNMPQSQRFVTASLCAVEVLRTIDPENREWCSDMASCYVFLGQLAVTLNNFREARRCYREALVAIRQFRIKTSADEYRQSVCLTELADFGERMLKATVFPPISGNAAHVVNVATMIGRLEVGMQECRSLHGEALELRRRGSEKNPDDVLWLHALAVSLERLGDICLNDRRFDDALRYFSEAVEIRRRLVAGKPFLKVPLSVAIGRLAQCVDAVDADPIPLFEEAVDAARIAVEFDPADTSAQFQLVGALATLAMRRSDLKDGSVATALLTEALKRARLLVTYDPTNWEWRRIQVLVLYYLAANAKTNERFTHHVLECRDCCEAMRQQGMHFDPELQRISNEVL